MALGVAVQDLVPRDCAAVELEEEIVVAVEDRGLRRVGHGGRGARIWGRWQGDFAEAGESGVNALMRRDFPGLESLWIAYGSDMAAISCAGGLKERAVLRR
jgi:hypothetical protein